MKERTTVITKCDPDAEFAPVDERGMDEQIYALFGNLIVTRGGISTGECERLSERIAEIAAILVKAEEPRELVALLRENYNRRPAPHVIAKIMGWLDIV